MKSRWLVATGMVAMLTGACGGSEGEPADGSSLSTAGVVDDAVDYGPFIGNDPNGVIAGVAWLEPSYPALSEPLDPPPSAVLMDGSLPGVLQVAVNGAYCKSEVTVSVVSGPPDLGLEVTVGDYIVEPGVECPETLTTHGFEVRLAEPVSLDRVIINGYTTGQLAEQQQQVDALAELRAMMQSHLEVPLPADTIVGCPGGPSFPVSALDETPLFVGAEHPGVDAALQLFLSDEEGQYWPQDGWQILYETEEISLLAFLHEGPRSIEFVGFVLDGGEWKLGFLGARGPCPLEWELPEGLYPVDWSLDPDGPPIRPDSTSIRVQVVERACASGEPVGDRLVGPEILMTDTEVRIAFAAMPQLGAFECPANPGQPVLVELPEPLGDRQLVDGLDLGKDLADYLS